MELSFKSPPAPTNASLHRGWRTRVAYLNQTYSILSSEWLTWIHSSEQWVWLELPRSPVFRSSSEYGWVCYGSCFDSSGSFVSLTKCWNLRSTYSILQLKLLDYDILHELDFKCMHFNSSQSVTLALCQSRCSPSTRFSPIPPRLRICRS